MLNRLKRVFRSFQEHDVRYVVIGGLASILYGVPRVTFDLDILIEPSTDNGQRLLDSLLESGIGTAALTNVEKLLNNEITVFKDIVRIDVQTSTPGLTFEEAWKRKVVMKYQDQDFYVLSKADLLKSKRASGRDIDLEDVRLIETQEDIIEE